MFVGNHLAMVNFKCKNVPPILHIERLFRGPLLRLLKGKKKV